MNWISSSRIVFLNFRFLAGLNSSNSAWNLDIIQSIEFSIVTTEAKENIRVINLDDVHQCLTFVFC